MSESVWFKAVENLKKFKTAQLDAASIQNNPEPQALVTNK